MGWIETYGHGGDLATAKQLFGNRPLVDFSANINPLGPPVQVLERIRDHMETIVHYPDPAQRVLKRKLADKLSLTPDHLVIGNGAAECMALIILALQPKKVGVIYPCFSEYAQLALAFGAEVEECHGSIDHGFKPDAAEAMRLFTKADLVFIGHPNNPTGVLYTREELTRLAEMARKTNTYLVIDEAFIDFVPDENRVTLLPALEEFPFLIFIRSMTKFYAIPGLRLGYAISDPDLIAKIRSKQVTWSVNQLALVAGEACLDEYDYGIRTITLIQEERSYVKHRVENMFGWFVFPGQANYLLVRLPENLKADDLQWSMGQKGILIRSCSMYPGLTPQDFRIAVRSRRENDLLLRAFQQTMEEGK